MSRAKEQQKVRETLRRARAAVSVAASCAVAAPSASGSRESTAVSASETGSRAFMRAGCPSRSRSLARTWRLLPSGSSSGSARCNSNGRERERERRRGAENERGSKRGAVFRRERKEGEEQKPKGKPLVETGGGVHPRHHRLATSPATSCRSLTFAAGPSAPGSWPGSLLWPRWWACGHRSSRQTTRSTSRGWTTEKSKRILRWRRCPRASVR